MGTNGNLADFVWCDGSGVEGCGIHLERDSALLQSRVVTSL